MNNSVCTRTAHSPSAPSFCGSYFKPGIFLDHNQETSLEPARRKAFYLGLAATSHGGQRWTRSKVPQITFYALVSSVSGRRHWLVLRLADWFHDFHEPQIWPFYLKLNQIRQNGHEGQCSVFFPELIWSPCLKKGTQKVKSLFATIFGGPCCPNNRRLLFFFVFFASSIFRHLHIRSTLQTKVRKKCPQLKCSRERRRLTPLSCRWSTSPTGSSGRGCSGRRRATCRCAGSASSGSAPAHPVGRAPTPPGNSPAGSYWAWPAPSRWCRILIGRERRTKQKRSF